MAGKTTETKEKKAAAEKAAARLRRARFQSACSGKEASVKTTPSKK
jgi:hypothetical protein